MPTITALLHTENDALRLGRCLETLYPCDEIVVVDHGSRDGTVEVAREYGARVTSGAKALSEMKGLIAALEALRHPKTASSQSLRHTKPDLGWILCLDPRESLSEGLAASLYEWKSEGISPVGNTAAFSIFLREETAEGWVEVPAAQTRLVPADWNRWQGRLPVSDPDAVVLEGELLRFVFP